VPTLLSNFLPFGNVVDASFLKKVDHKPSSPVERMEREKGKAKETEEINEETEMRHGTSLEVN
jgi:hypothetical protein